TSEAATRRATRFRDAAYRRLLGMADCLAVVVVVALAAAIVDGGEFSLVSLALAPAGVALAKLMGLYDRDAVLLRHTTLDEGPAALQYATLLTLGLFLLGGVLIDATPAPGDVLVLWPAFVLVVMFARALARAAARRIS